MVHIKSNVWPLITEKDNNNRTNNSFPRVTTTDSQEEEESGVTMVMKDVRVVEELKKTGPVSHHRVKAIHEGFNFAVIQ